MTLWRREYKCKRCGYVTLKRLSSSKIPAHSECPECSARDGWRMVRLIRVECSVDGCHEDARAKTGLCVRHEIRAAREKKQ